MKTSSKTKIFKGVFSALPTPFKKDGTIDFIAWENQIQIQIDAKIHGIVPCGTTGESPTLSEDEKLELIDRAVSICKKSNTLIIAGTGTNNTAESSYFTSLASQLKIDACLVVTPYYNKPSQEGLRQHFLEVAESTKNNIPIILYNVPSRTSVSLAPTTVSALSTHKKIIGIKEASANLALFTEMRRAVRRTKPENNFYFLSGDDATFWPFLASGGDGVISVTSNLVPNSMRVLFENWQDRKLIGGLTLFEKMFPLFTQLFIDSNPVPLKHLMGFLKIIPPYCRLPLSKLSDFNASKLLKTWKSLHSSIKEDRPVQNSK